MMTPTSEASERQRKAAFKAWETIRRKRAAEAKSEGWEIAIVSQAKEAISEIPERAEIRKTTISRSHSYPKNWKQIVAEIRERARNVEGREQCECHGECLKHRTRCEEINHTWPKYRRHKGKVKIRFTIAHLCHTPNYDDKTHLRAMCEPCHLIYDLRCRQLRLHGDNAIKWAAQQNTNRSLA